MTNISSGNYEYKGHVTIEQVLEAELFLATSKEKSRDQKKGSKAVTGNRNGSVSEMWEVWEDGPAPHDQQEVHGDEIRSDIDPKTLPGVSPLRRNPSHKKAPGSVKTRKSPRKSRTVGEKLKEEELGYGFLPLRELCACKKHLIENGEILCFSCLNRRKNARIKP